MDRPPVESGPALPAPGHAVVPDAAVGIAASLVFVTTGPQACARLGEPQAQVALTPVVAARVAEILKVSLQYPDLPTRQSIVEAWSEGERTQVPWGVVEIDLSCVRIGIEPLGAGQRVAVLWEHVPALVLHLEGCTRALRA